MAAATVLLLIALVLFAVEALRSRSLIAGGLALVTLATLVGGTRIPGF